MSVDVRLHACIRVIFFLCLYTFSVCVIWNVCRYASTCLATNSMDYGPRRLRPIEYGPRRKRTMLNAVHILLQNPRTDVRGESINIYLFSE